MTRQAPVDPAPYAARLRSRLAELQARLDGIEHDLDETPNPDADERATEREGDEVLESLGAAGLAEIRAIEAALDRVEAGEYGVCVACGQPIRAARLDAVPSAPRCAACA